jgi:hypothetical protein
MMSLVPMVLVIMMSGNMTQPMQGISYLIGMISLGMTWLMPATSSHHKIGTTTYRRKSWLGWMPHTLMREVSF